MPFVADRRLEDMIDPTAVTKAGRAMTDKGGDRLRRETAARTPIYTGETLGVPRDRRRGTARNSITRGVVRRHSSPLGRGWEVVVFTEDPVFPYIEWNTRPHRIEPTDEHRARAAAEGHEAMLRFPHRGSVRFAASVWHPGTTGQHPFARAAAWVQAETGHMFGEELAQFGRDLTENPRTGRVFNRTGRGSAASELDQAITGFVKSHTIPLGGGG